MASVAAPLIKDVMIDKRTYYAYRKGELWGCMTVGLTRVVEETQRPILYTKEPDEKDRAEASRKGFEIKEYQL